jgi:Cd2+/Zn2+-exporting ATPase
MHGVDDVKVNVIGRYAVVKHCPIPCCAPLETIIDKLNEKNLGVSIMEDLGDGEEDEEALDYFAIAQLLFITLFFLIGLVYSLQMGNESMGKNFFYVSIAVGGLLILQKAAFSLYLYRIDISVLMLIAVVGTCALGEFLDGALLLTLYNVAEVLEQNVMRYIRSVIKVSKGAVPQNAFLPSGEKVSVDTLKIGDVIAVRAGNMVAVDGVIVKGEGAFDESALTGEPLPQMKKKGDRAVSGALMQNGYLEIEIDTDVKQSTIRKLNDALLDVQAEKGNYARIVEQFATYWTPLVLTVAIGIFVIGGAVTSDWAKYGEESLTILVLACPCALVMAAPVPAVCAIATAAQNGVLIRGPQAIENGGLITSMAMDKTGTLTTGKYSVVDKLTISTSLEDGYYDPLEVHLLNMCVYDSVRYVQYLVQVEYANHMRCLSYSKTYQCLISFFSPHSS